LYILKHCHFSIDPVSYTNQGSVTEVEGSVQFVSLYL